MLRKNIVSRNYIIIFITILVIFLLEGFVCRFNISKFQITNEFCKSNFSINFWKENGFVENIQIVFLFLSILLLVKARKLYTDNKIVNYFLLIKIIALTYYFGEEVSWGQHLLKWGSPKWFLEHNLQNETNIHNISNIFDQLPRTMVLLWCLFSIPIAILLYNKRGNNKNLLLILCPDRNLIIISLLLFFFTFPNLIIDKFDLIVSYLEYTSDGITHPSYNKDLNIYRILTFNFIRLSEVQEYIFTCYFLYYSIAISKEFEKN